MNDVSSLFSGRSIWTMLHGIGLGGGTLLGLAAAIFLLYALRPGHTGPAATARQAQAFGTLTMFIAVLCWLSVLIGTYVIFPPYRATPPEGTLDLTNFPRALILANANSAWLHRIAMELKEHVPWIAAMLVTAVAFVAGRYRSAAINDSLLWRSNVALLGIAFALVSVIALLGTLINKFAPLI